MFKKYGCETGPTTSRWSGILQSLQSSSVFCGVPYEIASPNYTRTKNYNLRLRNSKGFVLYSDALVRCPHLGLNEKARKVPKGTGPKRVRLSRQLIMNSAKSFSVRTGEV